jgi:hypothetical protein
MDHTSKETGDDPSDRVLKLNGPFEDDATILDPYLPWDDDKTVPHSAERLDALINVAKLHLATPQAEPAPPLPPAAVPPAPVSTTRAVQRFILASAGTVIVILGSAAALIHMSRGGSASRPALPPELTMPRRSPTILPEVARSLPSAATPPMPTTPSDLERATGIVKAPRTPTILYAVPEEPLSRNLPSSAPDDPEGVLPPSAPDDIVHGVPDVVPPPDTTGDLHESTAALSAGRSAKPSRIRHHRHRAPYLFDSNGVPILP